MERRERSDYRITKGDMKYKFQVITKINSLEGNLYNPILYKGNGEMWTEAMSMEYREGNTITGPQAENFTVGEIFVVDQDTSREVNGKMKKPSKWDVEYEEFDNFDDAIKRAIEVTEN